MVNMAARLHQKVAKNNTELCKQMTAILQSPIGAIQVSGCDEGIHSIQLQESFVPKDRTRVASFSCELCQCQEEMTAPVKHCMTWLRAYFCEPRTTGKLPLPAFHHPIFQQATFTCKVLRTLLNDVEFGEMASYKQLATLAGNSKAARAVGGAMRSNPTRHWNIVHVHPRNNTSEAQTTWVQIPLRTTEKLKSFLKIWK
ncbi:methylated-DNA--protein-cysteine methyltransferase isoform X2 [Leucoraja erinacea]|uniref:methylated-DNA--protein-cysteine methyltransferase isoform X2 n=1 Tax=Leucoraja erinaceus TaxID=7782 RepID=UPI002458EEC6|nr:methylated-DNA--protein-cysteine methyltransferase isoform X2 [Leucoraja erinacea]